MTALLGAFWTLVATPFRENNPLLGIWVVLVLVIEAWVVIYTLGSWR